MEENDMLIAWVIFAVSALLFTIAHAKNEVRDGYLFINPATPFVVVCWIVAIVLGITSARLKWSDILMAFAAVLMWDMVHQRANVYNSRVAALLSGCFLVGWESMHNLTGGYFAFGIGLAVFIPSWVYWQSGTLISSTSTRWHQMTALDESSIVQHYNTSSHRGMA